MSHPPITKPGELSIIQSLDQVTLKELELVGLKNHNKNLEVLVMGREHERKSWESKCVEL